MLRNPNLLCQYYLAMFSKTRHYKNMFIAIIENLSAGRFCPIGGVKRDSQRGRKIYHLFLILKRSHRKISVLFNPIEQFNSIKQQN